MRSFLLRLRGIFAACFLFVLPASAGQFKPADFPLRVHIVARNGVRHYYRLGYNAPSSSLDQVDGLGAANVFENGQPRGFDFNYQCGQPITPQTGYETFMARWKKQDRVLEILMPVMGGKPGDMNTCELKVSMKQDVVYVRHNGAISAEPAAAFKQWMVKHEYDPEHGKDFPVNLPGAAKPDIGAAEPQ
ncbi:MAG TPA: hypothetical protein VGT08_11180 [Terracidiphilus sp.]|nr:hypothetical protein [Terracidiphilus sp.]